MSNDRVIMRVTAGQFAAVVQDLRLARIIVEMLAAASPSMQQLLLPPAIATEEAVAQVMWKLATDVAGRPGDRAISFALSSVGESSVFILESSAGTSANDAGADNDDQQLLALRPRGEA